PAPALDLTRVGQLTFHEPDVEKFPCLALARQALARGESAPVILNAANEIGVAAFLEGRIRFTQIPELIAESLDRVPGQGLTSVEECVAVDAEARRTAQEILRLEAFAAAGAH
ncbi:MAG: 1-deoxy-D-xylulose-5-phosphate reductoisomerase, partial [Anaerolineae bacterium]